VYVACSTLCFGRFPLERTLRMIGELEFSKLDVAIHERGPHLRPSEVAADVALAAQRIRIGPSLTPAAFSVEIEAAEPHEYERQLKAICRLARMSTVSLLAIPAGPSSAGIDAEVERLTPLLQIAQAEGMVLTVPTHIGCITETPQGAIKLCESLPGLGLTLDPSHFIAGPNQGKSYEHVFPYVRHVHLRDTGRGADQFQVRVGQGEVEYGRIISLLSRNQYERLLTVAIYDIPDAPFPMDSEVRKLKYLLESLI